jgi:ABC-2 type transport system ATP-binding protein
LLRNKDATVYNPVNSDNVCTDTFIKVTSLEKTFGKVNALKDLNLDVETGIVFALLGPNGSGKTTLVKILTTLLRPDAGTAQVGGFNVIEQASEVRTLIGLAGQYPAVDENLTGKENLEMIGRLYHLGKLQARVRALELLDSFELSDAANRRAKTYSGGMRRRLDLAAALVANPPILFLDEPTTGLDPRSRLNLWEVIKDQVKRCNSVFLTTQYLEEADRLADHIAIIDKGTIIQQGTSQELKDCCGGETHVKIRLTDRTQTQKAFEALREITSETINQNPEMGEITFPAPSGTSVLSSVVRSLDAVGIELAELGLKQPTLDDVFLAITGHVTEEEKDTNTSMTSGSK